MSKIKKGILEIIAVVLVVFTVVFLLNAYNKGDIGNKAEKVAETFSEKIEGTWYGKGEISSISFKPEGKTTLSILGIEADGEYRDVYSIDNDTHTLELKYKTFAGITVERTFNAKLNEDGDKLTLQDTQLNMVSLEFVRSNGTQTTEKSSTTVSTTKAKTEPATSASRVNQSVETVKRNLIGEWKNTNGTDSGYTFKEDSTVTIKLLGVSYEGKYTVTTDEETGRTLLRITYATLGISDFNNGYFVTVNDGTLTLVQRGAEKLSFTYNKA